MCLMAVLMYTSSLALDRVVIMSWWQLKAHWHCYQNRYVSLKIVFFLSAVQFMPACSSIVLCCNVCDTAQSTLPTAYPTLPCHVLTR